MDDNEKMRNAPSVEPVPAPTETPHCSTSRGRLLLVEDHDVNQILIQAMTKRLGYETELASDGTEAVERVDQSIAEDKPFDLILMDIQMPVMDGYEATRMIRTSGFSEEMLPIIAITANAFGDDIRNCLAAGMQAHIAKPIDISRLDSVLKDWVKSDASKKDGAPNHGAKNNLSDDLVCRYRARKQEAISSLRSLVTMGTYSNSEVREVSDQMHKLTGTAGIFGEEDLGNLAKNIENGLKQWKIADRPEKTRISFEHFLALA